MILEDKSTQVYQSMQVKVRNYYITKYNNLLESMYYTGKHFTLKRCLVLNDKLGISM